MRDNSRILNRENDVESFAFKKIWPGPIKIAQEIAKSPTLVSAQCQ